MASMLDMIERLCGDDRPLCESILYLYKHFGGASIKDALWNQIETKHKEGTLNRILAQKGSMVPVGVKFVVEGAYVRIYAGHGNDTQVARYNPGVGENRVERLTINIAPYVGKFTSAYDINYYDMIHHANKDAYYNELAYLILKDCFDDVCAKINDSLYRHSDNKQYVNKTVEDRMTMYSTDAAEQPVQV